MIEVFTYVGGATPTCITVWPVAASLLDDVDLLKAMLVAVEAELEQVQAPATDHRSQGEMPDLAPDAMPR